MNEKMNLGAGWERIRADAVESGRSMWLAGLGLVATLDETSRRSVDALISRGEKLEAREKSAWTKLLRENRERAEKLGRDVETRVEQELSSTLGRFGLPRATEIRDLIGRVERLTTEVEALGVARAR